MATAPAGPLVSRFFPKVPQNMEELGISQGLVLDMMLRWLLLEGYGTLTTLSEKLRLSVPIVDIVFRPMRQQQLVEVKGMMGNDYNFVLSQAGRALAGERFQVSQYAGAAPVCLKDYYAATHTQAAPLAIDRNALRSAFSAFILTARLL